MFHPDRDFQSAYYESNLTKVDWLLPEPFLLTVTRSGNHQTVNLEE